MIIRQTPGHASDHRFFIGCAFVLLAIVFAGFFRTYYLRGFFTALPLSTFLHVHGVVMTAWVAVFSLQVTLIAAHQLKWHRRVGIAGIGAAGLVVLFGCLATLRAAAREVAGHTANASSQLTVLGLELTQLLLFRSLTAAGIWMRRRPDYHKRLMLLATVSMLPNPISRLPISFNSNLVILLIFDGIVVSAVGIDALRRRGLHPAFLWGGTLVVAGLHAAFAVAYSSRWHAFATALVS